MLPTRLGRSDIQRLQKNRFPLLMVDSVEELVPYKSAVLRRLFCEREWFFEIHWPDDPNVPGALQLEMLFQAASLMILCDERNSGQVMYVRKIFQVEFLTKITPNMEVFVRVDLVSFRYGLARCRGVITSSNGCIITRAEFLLTLPSSILRVQKPEGGTA